MTCQVHVAPEFSVFCGATLKNVGSGVGVVRALLSYSVVATGLMVEVVVFFFFHVELQAI